MGWQAVLSVPRSAAIPLAVLAATCRDSHHSSPRTKASNTSLPVGEQQLRTVAGPISAYFGLPPLPLLTSLARFHSRGTCFLAYPFWSSSVYAVGRCLSGGTATLARTSVLVPRKLAPESRVAPSNVMDLAVPPYTYRTA